MTTSLPPRPDLDQLRHQAKDLLRAQQMGDPEVCTLLRHLHRFSRASDADILSADLKLNEVQFALALNYGFTSWDALKKHISTLSPSLVQDGNNESDSYCHIEEIGELTLVGMVSYGRDIHELWVEFGKYEPQIQHKTENLWYEYHGYTEGWEPGKPFYCMAAMNVSKAEVVPDTMFVKQVPAAKYAVYTHRFSLGGFDVACKTISKWFEESHYTIVGAFDIQRYDERFKGIDNPESELDFLMPVELKSGKDI